MRHDAKNLNNPPSRARPTPLLETPVIDDLIACFSPETFGEWCREKFDHFTSDPHAILDPGEFPKADIVGYVQSLPDAATNRPLLVMAVKVNGNINERSSRGKQFDFARKQLQAALDRPPPRSPSQTTSRAMTTTATSSPST